MARQQRRLGSQILTKQIWPSKMGRTPFTSVCGDTVVQFMTLKMLCPSEGFPAIGKVAEELSGRFQLFRVGLYFAEIWLLAQLERMGRRRCH